MEDLISRLLALSRCEHDDLSVAEEAATEIQELCRAVRWALEYIDAMPCDCHSEVTMPGFDRDYVENLIEQSNAGSNRILGQAGVRRVLAASNAAAEMGRITSEKKAASSRRNGTKGGRPRKKSP